METRTLGRTGLEVGVIGMGTEHLDTTRDNMDSILDLAVAVGINYMDIIYDIPFEKPHNLFWDSIIPAIRRHRDRLNLAVHWGGYDHDSMDHHQRCFDQVLELLGNNYVEIAMPALVDSESLWEGWTKDSITQLQTYQKDGRVGSIGFSTHRTNVAQMAVESGLIDVLMFPVNLYTHHGDKNRKILLEKCEERGVGVVAMKPFYGGRLLSNLGEPTGITPVQCLSYVLSQPVATTVPGVRNAEEMRQALTYLDASDEEKHYADLHDEMKQRLRGQCVRCGHCLPCPQEIKIPAVITWLEYLDYYAHGPEREYVPRRQYERMTVKASECIECRECLKRCPFGVDVIGKMRRAVEVFEST